MLCGVFNETKAVDSIIQIKCHMVGEGEKYHMASPNLATAAFVTTRTPPGSCLAVPYCVTSDFSFWINLIPCCCFISRWDPAFGLLPPLAKASATRV